MKRSRITSISLPPELVRYTDELARAEHKSRSEIVREAMESYRTAREWGELQAFGVERARKMGVRDETDVERVIHDYRRKRE